MYYILFFIMIYLIYLLYNINIIQLETLSGTKFTIYNNNNIEEKQILLSKVIEDMIKLKKHLFEIQNDFPEYKPYIIQLNKNFTNSRTKIYETNPLSNLTSYSVNKGEELSICLKSKVTGELHDNNLLIYVTVHEMSHFACPEVGHGELFQKIFKMFLNEAVKIGIYIKLDYSKQPVEYCGMNLTSSILL
jgi:hypothetical protein